MRSGLLQLTAQRRANSLYARAVGVVFLAVFALFALDAGGITAVLAEAAPAGLAPATLGLLVGIAFVAGVGITTIGPGGIFLTIALYALTPLGSGTIAGTAQAMFIGTGVVGTAMYVMSGELGGSDSRRVTAALSLASVGGALLGVYLNSFLSRDLFGLLLGMLAAVTGLVILYRERRDLPPLFDLDADTTAGLVGFVFLGAVLGCLSGLLGVGGPVITVPALLLVGVPMLYAVAIAQVQSVFIAVFAASGYLLQGALSVPLAAVLGVPLVLGVVLGWRVAHRVDPGRLKVALGGVLALVAPYLAL